MSLVLIEKYNKNHYFWKNVNVADHKPNLDIEIEEILLKYNGFEGTFFTVVNPGNKYYENLGELTDCQGYK